MKTGFGDCFLRQAYCKIKNIDFNGEVNVWIRHGDFQCVQAQKTVLRKDTS
jgi:hypothetical protein